MIGVLVTFAPEFGIELGTKGPVSAARSIACCYIGASLGGVTAGALSQYLKSRKKVIFLFLGFLVLLMPIFVNARDTTPDTIYFICALIGISGGYWSVFITTAAEQFGTNLRSTVTTTVPNFVRGSVVPVTLAFQALKNGHSLKSSALIVGSVVFLIGFWATSQLEESSQKDLSFVEV